MTQVSYVPIDEDGNDAAAYNKSSISYKALQGKTVLQQKALSATRRNHFRDTAERDLFKKYEALALPMTREGRLWAAWLANRIEIAASLNKKVTNQTMPKLLAAFGNEMKRNVWMTDNEAEILKKLSPPQLTSTMQKRMDTKITTASELESDL